MDGKPDVVKALKEGRSVLANSYGQLKGIANSTEVSGTISVAQKYVLYIITLTSQSAICVVCILT